MTLFAFVNRWVNPVVRWILRSPVHDLLSRWVALITVTGVRSGRAFTIPVIYRETSGGVVIQVGAPTKKRWWRNLLTRAPVELTIRRQNRGGTARAIETAGRVSVEVEFEM